MGDGRDHGSFISLLLIPGVGARRGWWSINRPIPVVEMALKGILYGLVSVTLPVIGVSSGTVLVLG